MSDIFPSCEVGCCKQQHLEGSNKGRAAVRCPERAAVRLSGCLAAVRQSRVAILSVLLCAAPAVWLLCAKAVLQSLLRCCQVFRYGIGCVHKQISKKVKFLRAAGILMSFNLQNCIFFTDLGNSHLEHPELYSFILADLDRIYK